MSTSVSRRVVLTDETLVFREYGIRCAIVATDSPLAHRLEHDHAMARTYADDQRIVFERFE